MAFTNSWNESTPTGKEGAKTTDNYLRKHRLDLGERLEEMFYGFNASDNSGAENIIGIKALKCYRQSSDPTQVTDYGHFYIKLVSGIPELFYQDDENTTLQITSGGKLYSSAGMEIVGNGLIGGTLDVVGNIDPTTFETTRGGFLDEDAMGSNSANKVASQQSIKAYVDTKEDVIVTQATAGLFGSWTSLDSESNSLVKSEVYKVGSDGVVLVVPAIANASLDGYTDGSNPPTTLRGNCEYAGGVRRSTINMPVRKDDYWKITATDGTPAISWLPFGTGGCVKQ